MKEKKGPVLLKIGYKFKDAYGDTITIDESNQEKYPYAIFYEDFTLDHLSILDFSDADVDVDDFKYTEKIYEEEVVIQSRAAPNPADKIKDNDGQDHPINVTYGDLSNNKRSFYKSNFDNANLSEATLKGNFNIASFKNANLSGANLTGASINGVNSFAGANLKDVIADGVSFVNTILKGVGSLQNAKLEKSNLYKVDLTNANLAGTNLTNANLNGANLSDVNLTGATLTDAIFTKKTQFSDGTKGLSDPQKAQMTLVVTFQDVLVEAKAAILTLVTQMTKAGAEVNAIKDSKPDRQVIKARTAVTTLNTAVDTLSTAAASAVDLTALTSQIDAVQIAFVNVKTEVNAITDIASDTNIKAAKDAVAYLETTVINGLAGFTVASTVADLKTLITNAATTLNNLDKAVKAIKDISDSQIVKAKSLVAPASQAINSLKVAIDAAISLVDLPKIKIEVSKAQAAVNNLKIEVDAIKDDANDKKIALSKIEIAKVKGDVKTLVLAIDAIQLK